MRRLEKEVDLASLDVSLKEYDLNPDECEVVSKRKYEALAAQAQTLLNSYNTLVLQEAAAEPKDSLYNVG